MNTQAPDDPLTDMKFFTQIGFILTSIPVLLLTPYQAFRVISLFQIKAIDGGGIGYRLPDHLPMVLLILALNIAAFLIAVFIGFTSLELIKGNNRRLKAASILAFLLPPIGPIAAIFGILYARSLRDQRALVTS